MKHLNRFLLIILAALSLTNLQADHSIQLTLLNDPRFQVELTLPDDLFSTVLDQQPNTMLLANQNGTLAGWITFIKNGPDNIHLEKWPTIVEDEESNFPEKCLIDSPSIILPTLPGAFATHSIVVQMNENVKRGTNIIQTENYTCLINLYLKGTLEEMIALCQSIAKGLKLTISD